MGHITGKEIYRKLGDNLPLRTPWSNALYEILKELYTPEEAQLVCIMPYGMSNLDRIARLSKLDKNVARNLLDVLCDKGLVIDAWIRDEYYYMPSPMVIGIFEFTMMRTGGNLNSKKWARLFQAYMHDDKSFIGANFGAGQKVGPMRTLPHEEVIQDSAHMEILDYEKATEIVEQSNRFSMAYCPCRHEKLHLGTKTCKTPIDNCSSFGIGADYLIRHKLAREVTKSEMLENVARSKQMGLVLNADNVQKNLTYLCHCCKCCCSALHGISRLGYPNSIVTSSFISEVDEDLCTGCGKCAQACPIEIIEMVPIDDPSTKKKANPVVDKSICLGCGVCALSCNKKAIQLVKREKRVIHPGTTFKRIILQSLERGTLQNQLFDDPGNITHKFMRGMIGGFLRLPPVKKGLMSDRLRSRFLAAMKKGAAMQGKGWALDI
jgi:Pyruvate/2-oxoacid:ferredoxin oxidoreductase delta subunit